jgi:penicillin-binding protein-related factor A (putative recombinase)
MHDQGLVFFVVTPAKCSFISENQMSQAICHHKYFHKNSSIHII